MPIKEARKALKTEQRKIRAEYAAFEEFEQRVAELTLAPQSAQRERGAIQFLPAAESGPKMAEVRTAYEETVREVAHYDEEYEEELVANVRAELGTEYAELLQQETDLSPELRQRLLSAAADVRNRRARFLEILEDEETVLDQTEAFIVDVQPLPKVTEGASFDQLCETDDTLCRYENQVETFLSNRQDHLHRSSAGRSRSNRVDPKLLNQYLYRSLEATHPVLDALARLLADIRASRRAVARRISTYRG